MTPTRALVGLAVVAAVGYAVVSSTSSTGPKYLGDMPSLMAKASAAPPPVRHFGSGTTVPDPPHYAAHPVAPEAPAAALPAVPGPGPIGAAGPVGGGGAGNGEPVPQPGVGSPTSGLPPGLLNGLPLLGALVGSLPSSVDVSQVCVVAGRVFALVPCNKLPPGTVPPVTGPPVTSPPVTSPPVTSPVAGTS